MAWTTPRTWVTNETMTATLLNTHVRDNLNALYGTDSTYTPTLSQGVSTNIAKTVNEARYIQTGRIVDVWVTLTPTASGTSGSAVNITLPVTASGHLSSALIGSGFYYNGTTFFVGAWRLTSTTTATIYVDNNTNAYGAAPSLAVASGNVIAANLRYVVA